MTLSSYVPKRGRHRAIVILVITIILVVILSTTLLLVGKQKDVVSDSSSSSSSNNLRPVTDSPSKLPTVTVVVAEGGDTKNNDTQETGTAVLSRPVAIDDSPWYQDQVLLTTAQQQPVTNSFDNNTIEEESIANTSAIDIDSLSTLAIVDRLEESANATEPDIEELVDSLSTLAIVDSLKALVSSSVVTVVNFDNNNEQPSELVATSTQPTPNPDETQPTTTTTIDDSYIEWETITCPSKFRDMVTISPGHKQVAVADTNTFCGIFLRKSSSGDLIPMARSYHGHDWEPSPGPLACNTEDVSATTVILPDPKDSNDEYVILSKDGSMDKRASIARFLELTTFGTTKSELLALDNGNWDDAARATYVRNQMNNPATSHREYWRKRTNVVWDATTQNARSDHPCSPNSKWRKYSYTLQDRLDTNTDEEPIKTTFEIVPDEIGLVTTLYEADSEDDEHITCERCKFGSSEEHFSGDGYYDFGGTDDDEDFLEFTINVDNGGSYPISFRYSMASRRCSNNCPLKLEVNDVTIVDAHEFVFTGEWDYWKYSELIDVNLNAGTNRIKLAAIDQDEGPNIDHLRVGKPPAIVMKTNGWPRVIAKNGLHLLNDWNPTKYEFNNETEVTFGKGLAAPQGSLYNEAHFGLVRIRFSDNMARILDIGNPLIDFTGYEQYLPPNVFEFDTSHIFEETVNDLQDSPITKGQELLLTNGYTGPVCDNVPMSVEEGDAPIFGKLPNGKWLQWTPTIMLENNGPSINEELNGADNLSSNVLRDGGGAAVIASNKEMKCSSTPRSFVNEDTCFLSTEPTACSATVTVGEMRITLDTTNIVAFHDLTSKYVYAIQGLVLEEDISESPCAKPKSRWTRESNTICPSPSVLQAGTVTALEDALSDAFIDNEYVVDAVRSLDCDASDFDDNLDPINIQLQIDEHCYTHVHQNHLNVYDFTGWVDKHPGGAHHIQKWSEGWNGNEERWNLVYPFSGAIARGIPEHPMQRWYDRVDSPDIEYVGKFGDDVRFRDLPNSLKATSVAAHFGAVSQFESYGTIICGSRGEVANDPTLGEHFGVRSQYDTDTRSKLKFDNQKQEVWTEIALTGNDQLRQRIAWALAQIITVVPDNIDTFSLTEIYLAFYDIFVKHAFGNYRDILAEASFSPLMAEHLSYRASKSHSYIYEDEDKRIRRADENYAREIMQLFTIGLNVLNDDGRPVIDPNTGNPLETYTNEDIESFARAWTGFDRVSVRGNYEDRDTGTTDNRLDPIEIVPAWRDPFPKSNLNGGFIGDAYPLCIDLPDKSFLKTGAEYRLLGSKSSPELMNDPSYYEDDNVLRLELDPTSALYQELYNGGNYDMSVELDTDLPCTTDTAECDVDTVRVVKVENVYYEFVERPCVQLSFFDKGKQIMVSTNKVRGTMCANSELAHAREACCRQERKLEVRDAMVETGMTYLYEGERMKYDTARARCVDYGRDLCVYEDIEVAPKNDNVRIGQNGYHWTNKDCGINVKVNPENGYIAIIHDATTTYKDTIHWHVEEENTLNWFRVNWDGGSYPGSSEANTCEANHCKTKADGSCLCKTTVSESVVFTEISSVTKEDVISQLFIGSLGVPEGSIANTKFGNGVTAHVVGDNVDARTVFEVQDKGRTMYLKNILYSVGLEGWTMVPQIYEAEDAEINNADVRDKTSSATGGKYVYTSSSDDATFVKWNVDVPSAGEYLISLRYALDSSPSPLNVFVNGKEVVGTSSPVVPIQAEYIGGSPSTILQRCQGDCDNDDDCADGLFCMQSDSMEALSGCTGDRVSSWSGDDYCMDVNSFEATYGFVCLPTGDLGDDWHYTKPLKVNLNAGINTVRVQVPDYHIHSANIDHLKIEGLPTTSSLASFRNPPHFVGLIPEYKSYMGEMNLRDAKYETDAVIDHLFYQDNMAPFLCVRVMQRFSFSNPSPRFVSSCVNAFRSGTYNHGGEVFGNGEYGSLEAMVSSIVLDQEATVDAITSDPSYGSIKEPMLKVIQLMRSMEYQPHIPTTLDGNPMQTTYITKLWRIYEKIGHGPYEFPTVFSFFLPEYLPSGGPALAAKLTSPESLVVTTPNIVNLLNGLFSLIKYGLSDCNDGFTQYIGYGGECKANGLYERSIGHLTYDPEGSDDMEKARDLSLLLTSDRLSDNQLTKIVNACNPASQPVPPSLTIIGDEGDWGEDPLGLCQGDCDEDLDCKPGYKCFQRDSVEPVPGCLGEGNSAKDYCYLDVSEDAKTRCIQQLIITTSEFHTTNSAILSGEDRAPKTIAPSNNEEPYKAIVYFFLNGGADSYNLLAPFSCAPIDVYERYRVMRGKSEGSVGVGLPLSRLLEIKANNPEQPCQSFGIHEELPLMKNLYDQGDLLFIANAGLMAKPGINSDNYQSETPVQLFAHNTMTGETKREDIFNKYAGTGVGGRMGDVLASAGISTNLFSLDGEQIMLSGEVGGGGPMQNVMDSGGFSEFNSDAATANMDDVMKSLNNRTTSDSGFFAETWSSKFYHSLDQHKSLKGAVDATEVVTEFPRESVGEELEMVTRIMQTREARGVKRDIFLIADGGYDTHANVDATLIDNFSGINAAMQAFVDELKLLNLWENTVVVQFSEFARTLDPNSGSGTDHAWGGHHFMFGGNVNGGQVLGKYPKDFVTGDEEKLALNRGRMIPTRPWDAMWLGVSQWFGINKSAMDKVLPMHRNFPSDLLYSSDQLFSSTSDSSSQSSASATLPNDTKQICLRIITGGNKYDDGFITVFIDKGDGNGYVLITQSDVKHALNSVVLQECYTNLVGVQVTNKKTNAWVGSIETSVNNGNEDYYPMVCEDGCSPLGGTTSYITIDGDDIGREATSSCINGARCTLKNNADIISSKSARAVIPWE